ncbi:hypothetical protein V8F06_007809 [Rhypophila decipiens]
MSTSTREPRQFRARTGCLTCRDRHIKCDEAVPRCRNCAKSDRICERGIRLNFIDIQTPGPQPHKTLPPGTQLVFRDESHNVASGYTVSSNSRTCARQLGFEASNKGAGQSEGGKAKEEMNPSPTLDGLVDSSRLVNRFDESLLIEVFIEKVGPWMDSLDPSQPFTTVLPFYALTEDTGTVHWAMLACGARYLMPTETSFYQTRAFDNFQGHVGNMSKQNSLLCVVTAVLLTACEAISDDGIACNHIEATTELINRLNITGSSPGLEGACFWFMATVTLIYGLRSNVPLVGYNPERMRYTMDGTIPSAGGLSGDEGKWAQRMIYICTKVAELRANISHNVPDYTVERVQKECEQYKEWCDEWARSVPRSMMPLCYIPPAHSEEEGGAGEDGGPSSIFPHILLVKPCATIARLLYHTSCLILAHVHIMAGTAAKDRNHLESMKRRHAVDICGIASQAEDKYVTPKNPIAAGS